MEVHSGIVIALNTWQKQYSRNTPIPNIDKLAMFFDKPAPGLVSRDKVVITTAQHAELTVATYLAEDLRTRKAEGIVELGVSKASCYWCQTYLAFLNNAMHSNRVEIVNRATHGKCTDGWLIPESPSEVRRQMLDHIGNTMQHVFDTLNNERRKSDSVPLAVLSGDEAEEEEEAITTTIRF